MKKSLLIHDTFLTKGGAERMNIEIAKILDADIATAVWHENGFNLADFDYDCEIFLTQKNFKRGMLGFLKMKWSFWKFSSSLLTPLLKGEGNENDTKPHWGEVGSFFLSNEASTSVWNLPKNSKKIFYAHSISRHLFDLYDDYLAKVPTIAKIPYRIMAWILKKMYIAELRRFDIILTNSTENQKRLKEWCNIDAKVLFPPVNTDKFVPLTPNPSPEREGSTKKIFIKYKNYHNFLPKNPPLPAGEGRGEGFYLSFSRVNDTKWVDKIIAAFTENPTKNLLVIFWTEDSHREEFQTLSGIDPTKEQNTIFQSEQYPNIFWLSLAQNEDLPEIIANATATICMSKNEDFGMIAIESMACGVPVIAPDEGGYRETIVHGETGVLLEKNSAVELAKVIEKIDDTILKNMKNACVEQAEKFSLKKFEENLRRFL